MKNYFSLLSFIFTLIFFTSNFYSQSQNEGRSNHLNSDKIFGKEYFPTELKKTLIYDSSFGDLELKVTKEKDIHLFSYDSEKFKYRQKLFVNDNGLFVNETYQKIKLLLFITKEGNYVYDKPLLRVPFPVKIGQEWAWVGKEFVNDETHTVNIRGKASKTETITLPAGKFETLKVETTLETSNGTKNVLTEWYAKDLGMVKMLVSIEGGGMLGFARDVLGYGTITFELKEIKAKN
ncbi:MAG: DUF3108 domain-containing protein [Ignavibacterium sp.]|jgi:hypothetical protein|nr:DUF3108 domain-containing protein [Ignavibacterium sp.]